MNRFNLIILIMISILLLSCTSSKTIKNPKESEASGINYYMPMKDLVFTIVTDDKAAINSVSISTTNAYPNTETQYLLKYSRNFFGKNTMDITIKGNGLLTKSNSTTVSAVNSSLTGLAQSFASLSLNTTKTSKEVCQPSRTYTYLKTFNDIKIIKSIKFQTANLEELGCGLKFQVLAYSDSSNIKSKTFTKTNKRNFNGIFYKQELPYIVSIFDD